MTYSNENRFCGLSELMDISVEVSLLPADMLRAIASAIEGLHSDEVSALINGAGRLVFVPNEEQATPPKSKRPPIDVSPLAEEFNRCQSREDGQRVLAERAETKEQLIALAKHFSIHVEKHDRRDDLERKLLNGVIGSRLGAEAIRSLSSVSV